MPKINADEFASRLETLCLQRGGRGLPKKDRDRQILFKSVTITLDPNQAYTENQLNTALGKWLSNIGRMIDIDHVTLRRYLVDEGYLNRDAAGTAYSVRAEATVDLFDSAIDELDPLTLLEQAIERREQRKQLYLQKNLSKEK